ncbi:DnaJ sub B member 8 [Actinomortierella ambigua]|uniref:DnaJ sub B member 8 n=1 Tax=Actinomortierella ambigua TaxID=1343610 RepID=A0A9P6QJB3_9FUNG|nr:DnaJ sub B member 8 [Actinomortierella ambigua]
MTDSDEEIPNYYEVLCVEASATKDDIRKAYRRQALLFHPDKMKPHMQDEASKHFQVINEAYAVLSDDTKRELYDRYGVEGVRKGGNPNPEPEPNDLFNHAFFQNGFAPPRSRSNHQHYHHHPHPSDPNDHYQQHHHYHHHHHHQRPHDPFSMPPFFDSPFGHPLHTGTNTRTSTSSSSSSSSNNNNNNNNNNSRRSNGRSSQRGGFSDHHDRHMRAFHDMMGMSMGMGMGMGMGMDMGMGMGMDPGFGSSSMFQSMHNAPSTSERPSLFATSPFVQQFGPASTSSFSSSFSTGSGPGVRSHTTRTTVVNGQQTTVTEEVDNQGVKTTTVDAPDGSRTIYTDDGVRGTQRVLVQGTSRPAATTRSSLPPGTTAQRPIFIEEEDHDHPHHRGAFQQQQQQQQPFQQQQQPFQQQQFQQQQSFEVNGSGGPESDFIDMNGYDASNPIVLDDPAHAPAPASASASAPPPLSSSRRGEATPLHHAQYGQGQTLRGSSKK